MGIKLADCYNTHQFRKLAKARLPGPIFHYIDGAADDEVTYRRNTAAYESCDLVPNVLTGVDTVDLSTTVMDIPIDMPLFLSPRRCSGCSIMTASGRSVAQRRPLTPYLGFLH